MRHPTRAAQCLTWSRWAIQSISNGVRSDLSWLHLPQTSAGPRTFPKGPRLCTHRLGTLRRSQPILHWGAVRAKRYAYIQQTHLQTHPIEYPVSPSHSHQSKEKDLEGCVHERPVSVSLRDRAYSEDGYSRTGIVGCGIWRDRRR